MKWKLTFANLQMHHRKGVKRKALCWSESKLELFSSNSEGVAENCHRASSSENLNSNLKMTVVFNRHLVFSSAHQAYL